MMQFLEVAMLALLFVMLMFVGALASALVLLAHRNRISPGTPSPAPLTWLWLPTAAPRVHRRLRRAIRAARCTIAHGAIAGIAVGGLADCADDLERHALALDEQLVIASRFGLTTRHAMLRGLRAEVHEIETLAGRISTTVVARSAVAPERAAVVATRVTERLDALDAANRELATLESSWHATTQSPLPSSSQRARQAPPAPRARRTALFSPAFSLSRRRPGGNGRPGN